MRTAVRQFGTVGMVIVVIAVGCAMPLTENPDASVTPAPIAISTTDLVPPAAEPDLVERGRWQVEDLTPYLKITPTVASLAYPAARVTAPALFLAPTDVPDRYLIRLQAGTIDTQAGQPSLPDELRLDGYPTGEPGYYLVQFTDAILPEWKTAVQKTGAELLGYVPNNTFIVRMTDAQRALVTALSAVQWIGIYQPAYRISSMLSGTTKGKSTLLVMTFAGADLESVKAQLENWGGTIQAHSESELGGMVRVTIDRRFVTSVARLNGVMWIESYLQPKLQGSP